MSLGPFTQLSVSTHFFQIYVKYGLNVTKFDQQLFPRQPLHALKTRSFI